MFDRCFVLVILSATTDVNKLSITPSEDNIKEKKIISGISFSVGIYIENSGIPVGIAPISSWGGCDVDYEWQLPMVEYWLKKNGIKNLK